MLRVLLAAMVPCFAIGLAGLLVTSIGRLLLAVGTPTATYVALFLTIAIMVGCAIAAAISSRYPERPARGAHVPGPRSAHH